MFRLFFNLYVNFKAEINVVFNGVGDFTFEVVSDILESLTIGISIIFKNSEPLFLCPAFVLSDAIKVQGDSHKSLFSCNQDSFVRVDYQFFALLVNGITLSFPTKRATGISYLSVCPLFKTVAMQLMATAECDYFSFNEFF